MSGDQLRTALEATPFQPFRLHLADQRKVDVMHPEFALIVSLTPIDDAPAGTRAA